MTALQEAVITYGRGRCNLAANRDYWDAENGLYACGFNPDAEADGTLVDDTLLVARVTDAAGALLATLVNYGCHPTTLAWENTLISPDYVGALRATVEAATGAPCVFALGACGELGPRRAQQGSTEVADQNGRQLGHAALAVVEALDPPATDYHYAGPVVSGATLGTWAHQPLTDARRADAARFTGGRYTVDLPMRARAEPATLEAEMNDWLAQQQQADARGDTVQARDFGARAERARRWLMRTAQLPDGDVYPFPFSVFRLGNAFWITTGGEPYSQLQTALRQRFPSRTLLVTPVVGEMLLGYLLPQGSLRTGLVPGGAVDPRAGLSGAAGGGDCGASRGVVELITKSLKSMNILETILTSAFTILGGIFVFVVGQVVVKFFLDPFQKYREVVGEIAHSLVYYANVTNALAEYNAQRMEAAQSEAEPRKSVLEEFYRRSIQNDWDNVEEGEISIEAAS